MADQPELKRMVKELCDLEDGLTPWEVEFVERVSRWTGDFTDRQAHTIEKIWNERIGNH